MPPTLINYFGTEVEIKPDPTLAYWITAFRNNASGLLAIVDLGTLALAHAWPSDGPTPPWLTTAQAELDRADADCKALEGELKVSHKLGQTDADRREIQRELQEAMRVRETARIQRNALAVSDIPPQPADQALVARRIRAAFEAAGVPGSVVANWAVQVVAHCVEISDGGWKEWAKLEASGFSKAPAGNTSSGASESPASSVETPSAGLS